MEPCVCVVDSGYIHVLLAGGKSMYYRALNSGIVSCPDPTQLTQGEGVRCHKSKSLG